MGIAERKEREKKQRREEIISAAQEVFFEKGFDGATMDDVAERAELSKGTLYLYFKSKDDLQLAISRRSIKLLEEYTREVENESGNALQKLLRMGQRCVEFSRNYPDHMKAILTLEGIDPDDISMDADDIRHMLFTESTVGAVLKVVEQGIEEELIRSDIPAQLIAHTLWMSVVGVIRFVTNKLVLLEMLDVSPEKVYESHFELVINGIRS